MVLNSPFIGETDYDPNCGFTAKYNSRAAALLRDKISTEAAGGVWDRRASPALNHKPSSIGAGSAALTHGTKVYQSSGGHVSAGECVVDRSDKMTGLMYGCISS